MNDRNDTHPENARYQQALLLAKTLGPNIPGLISGDFNMGHGFSEADVIGHEQASDEAWQRSLASFNYGRCELPMGGRSGAEHESCGDNIAVLRAFAEQHGIALPADVPSSNP